MVYILVSIYFDSSRLGHTIKTNYKTLATWSRDMLNFALLEKALGLVSLPHFAYDFTRKMFLMFYPINWPNVIVWLLLLLEILGNMYMGIICLLVDDVINFKALSVARNRLRSEVAPLIFMTCFSSSVTLGSACPCSWMVCFLLFVVGCFGKVSVCDTFLSRCCHAKSESESCYVSFCLNNGWDLINLVLKIFSMRGKISTKEQVCGSIDKKKSCLRITFSSVLISSHKNGSHKICFHLFPLWWSAIFYFIEMVPIRFCSNIRKENVPSCLTISSCLSSSK